MVKKVLYREIAENCGGEYVNLTQASDNVYYINPFHVPEVVPDRDKFIAEKAELGARVQPSGY